MTSSPGAVLVAGSSSATALALLAILCAKVSPSLSSQGKARQVRSIRIKNRELTEVNEDTYSSSSSSSLRMERSYKLSGLVLEEGAG
jgi:hypothetical protein